MHYNLCKHFISLPNIVIFAELLIHLKIVYTSSNQDFKFYWHADITGIGSRINSSSYV